MATINGCNLPEDVYYLIEKHVWAKEIGGGVIRVGMSSVAGKLSGGKLAAVTVKTKAIGQEVAQGKSVATVESSKFVGPVPAPVTGILVRGNEKLDSDPNLAISDPYGEGWIAEINPTKWESEKNSLPFGSDGVAEYKKKLEADNISCS
ncbi:MAG: glycine cleavage system protein H [Anaerolineaceae bacterium]